MRPYTFLILILFLSLTSGYGQEVQQKIPETTRILFLLDGSGSMLAKWKDEIKIDVAKDILTELVDSLKTDPDIELALRVYGHRYDRKSKNCKDTRLEVPFGKNNHKAIQDKLDFIKPKGTTPIAYSLSQAAKDFPGNQGYRNIVIMITDGIESCGGDPCSVSLELQKQGVFLKPFIIGIGGISEDYDKEFQCIGEYYNALNKDQFKEALNNVILTTMAETTATVELINSKGKKAYTNVNVTFENAFTNTPAFDFIHYLDARGNPDTVELDPVLDYHVVVNTIPEVRQSNVRIKPGAHNAIKIATPQGKLLIVQPGSNAYKKDVEVIMKNPDGDIIHIQDINKIQQYLTGVYEAVITTLPRQTIRISIEEDQTKTINIPRPGILNLGKSKHGFGSIYKLNENNRQDWVAHITPSTNRTAWTLQPGKYKIVFRSVNAQGSKYTTIQYFTITSGSSTYLQLF